MERSAIEQIILEALDAVNQSREPDDRIGVAPDARLYGKDGQMDSLGLVALLLDIEEDFQEKGIMISLSDERAMSFSRSPFKDVPSLIAHIQLLMTQADEHAEA